MTCDDLHLTWQLVHGFQRTLAWLAMDLLFHKRPIDIFIIFEHRIFWYDYFIWSWWLRIYGIYISRRQQNGGIIFDKICKANILEIQNPKLLGQVVVSLIFLIWIKQQQNFRCPNFRWSLSDPKKWIELRYIFWIDWLKFRFWRGGRIHHCCSIYNRWS